MSKKTSAPGTLEVVRAFVNTVDLEENEEQLHSPAALSGWLADNGLAPGSLRASRRQLQRAIELREALREILLCHNDVREPPRSATGTLDDVACRARIRLRFDNRGRSVLEPQAEGVDGALGRLLAIVHESIGDGTWERLKACRASSCEWAFYDHTKNHSGAWCSMASCGNRAKARAYRERHA